MPEIPADELLVAPHLEESPATIDGEGVPDPADPDRDAPARNRGA